MIDSFFFKLNSVVQRALEKKLIKQIIPLHNKETLNRLRETWVWPKVFFKPQPFGNTNFAFKIDIDRIKIVF